MYWLEDSIARLHAYDFDSPVVVLDNTFTPGKDHYDFEIWDEVSSGDSKDIAWLRMK